MKWLGSANTRNLCKLMGLQILFLFSGILGHSCFLSGSSSYALPRRSGCWRTSSVHKGNSTLRVLGFLPQSQATKSTRDLGSLPALILGEVRFYPAWRWRNLLSLLSVCWRTICWLNTAVSSPWLAAPFWSNLLTFFLIFLNSKH